MMDPITSPRVRLAVVVTRAAIWMPALGSIAVVARMLASRTTPTRQEAGGTRGPTANDASGSSRIKEAA